MMAEVESSATIGRPAILSRLMGEPIALIALVLLFLAVAAALLAPLIAPYDPYLSNVRYRLSPPGAYYLLGGDLQGRDMLTRMLFGLRTTLFIGLLALAISAVVGTLLGLLAAFYPRLDSPIMRLVDVLLAFPAILFGLALATVLGAGIGSLLIALGLSAAPTLARIARSAATVVMHEQYLEGGVAAGLSDSRLLIHYVALNAAPTILIYSTLQFGQIILLSAALSFLGLGPQPPIAELGLMAAEGRNFIFRAPHVAIFPGILIFVVALSVNILGDTMRDLLDPRLQVR